MTKSELKRFLKKKLKELPEEEQKYLEEEIKALNLQQDDVSKILKMLESGEKLDSNTNRVLSLYLLDLAPKPEKLRHLWSLADAADVDLDFSPDGRDKIKAWLKEKFGEENCISIGTYGTMGAKGSIQDVARVFNIRPQEYLPVSKAVDNSDVDLDIDDLRKKYPAVDEFLDKHPEVADTAFKLVGMKRNIGQHAGGFIVSSDNVYDHVPIVRSSKAYVSGWQETGAVKELEPLGFIKIDILGLVCVEQIRRCVAEINKKYPDVNIEDPYLLPVDDPEVYKFINTLELENVFQMESRVFKEAVRKIKPMTLQDLSNISTLIRPGAACTVDEYVEAKDRKRVEPSCVKDVYEDLRGYMLYQENLMQILMILGGFNIYDADKVRRLVRRIGKSKTTAANRKAMVDESEIYHKKFIKHAVKKIIDEDGWDKEDAENYAEFQWTSLMGQAAYSFNMPHSYSYTLMGYVQAYLKCYYPLEFWTAALNTIDRGLEKHGQSSLGNYVNKIVNTGIEVAPPDVNKSEIDFYGNGSKIYFALSYIKGVASGAEPIIANRPYKDWDEFLEKATKLKFNKRVVHGLIFSGACDFQDDVDDRPYKWLQYLMSRKKGKKALEEIEKEKKKYFKNGASIYVVIAEEYDLLKYSFTGIQGAVKGTKFARVPLISDRDPQKKLWVLMGYIDNMKMKKSKKSGKSYLLLTLTDFREPLQVYVFGDYKTAVQEKFHKGQLVKCAIKNDNNWPKLPWASEVGLPRDKLPIEAVM